MISEYGAIDLDIARDRNGEFESQIIPKYQRKMTGIEGQILSLCAKGMINQIRIYISYKGSKKFISDLKNDLVKNGEKLKELGFEITLRDKMPDIVLYLEDKN